MKTSRKRHPNPLFGFSRLILALTLILMTATSAHADEADAKRLLKALVEELDLAHQAQAL